MSRHLFPHPHLHLRLHPSGTRVAGDGWFSVCPQRRRSAVRDMNICVSRSTDDCTGCRLLRGVTKFSIIFSSPLSLLFCGQLDAVGLSKLSMDLASVRSATKTPSSRSVIFALPSSRHHVLSEDRDKIDESFFFLSVSAFASVLFQFGGRRWPITDCC